MDLDSLTLGLHQGEVTLLAARPWMGRSSFVTTLAHNVAVKEGLPVAVIAPKATEIQFTNRLISVSGFIPTRKIDSGALSDEDWEGIAKAVERLKDANVFLMASRDHSVEEFCNRTTQLAERFNGVLGLIVIDDVHLINQTQQTGDTPELRDVFKRFQLLARKLQCPVVVTQSLDRPKRSALDDRPLTSHIPQWESIEAYVDNVAFIHRDTGPTNSTEAEIIVARQKRGPSGTVKVYFDPLQGYFGEHFLS